MSRATVPRGVLLIVSRVAIIFWSPVAICSARCFHPEMASSWNPCERTSADYHAGGLTIVTFGESLRAVPLSFRLSQIPKAGRQQSAWLMKTRTKSGELSPRFRTFFSRSCYEFRTHTENPQPKPGAGRNCFCGRNARVTRQGKGKSKFGNRNRYPEK